HRPDYLIRPRRANTWWTSARSPIPLRRCAMADVDRTGLSRRRFGYRDDTRASPLRRHRYVAVGQ
ncbi:MAG: hypothetical protein ACYDH5_18985, partial [Acidimicrobiales bacterium]